MKVCFLSGLKQIVGSEEVDWEYKGRLSGLLEVLCTHYGSKLRCLIMDPDCPGRYSPFLKILVNGEDAGRNDPELQGAETVFLFLPIAGG